MRTLLLAVLLCTSCASALEWSEILFNPSGNDNGKEYVELLGTKGLDGCTIADSKSSDLLVLVQPGSDVILIVETNSSVPVGGATVYTVGNAIGDNLGNTQETLVISCNNTTLLSTAYNVADIPGFKEGFSIVYDGGWSVGTPNGTPGRTQDAGEGGPMNGTFITNKIETRECNPALSILLSRTSVEPGDRIIFTILSDHPASFTVTAESGEASAVLLDGDTMLVREYGVIVPDAEVLRFRAEQEACDGRQRATRVVKITPPHDTVAQPEPVVKTANDTVELKAASAPGESTQQASIMEPVPPVTGHIILDKDRDVVPWIAAFGVAVLILAGLVFRHAVKSGEL